MSHCFSTYVLNEAIWLFYPTRILELAVTPLRIDADVRLFLFFADPVSEKFFFLLFFIDAPKQLIIVDQIRFVRVDF